MTTPPLDGFAGWAVELMHTLGALGAGLVIALENVFPPLPSEAVLPLAGFTAAQGGFSLAAALTATTVGSVVGAVVLYVVAAAIGRERVRSAARRMPLVRVSDVDRAEAWFARHGTTAVFFGRMVPVLRSVISVPAGVERMRPAVFVGLTAAGSLVWNAVFVLAGYALGENWAAIEPYAAVLEKAVLVLVVAALAYGVGTRVLRSRRGRVPGRHHHGPTG